MTFIVASFVVVDDEVSSVVAIVALFSFLVRPLPSAADAIVVELFCLLLHGKSNPCRIAFSELLSGAGRGSALKDAM